MEDVKVFLGRVIDAVRDGAVEDGAVVTEGERIVYAGSRSGMPDTGDAPVYTCENATLMPGFIDAHIHLVGSESIHRSGSTPYDLLLTTVRDLGDLVDAGVTGVRDMSAFGRPLRDAVAMGNIRGPRIMVGGRVLSMSSGHCDFDTTRSVEECNRDDLTGYMMDGPEACYRGVREQFRQGAEFIKICATGGVSSAVDDVNDQEFSPEELAVIIGEAKRHNTYVSAHCTGTSGTLAALKAGIGCVEHGVKLDEECVRIMKENHVPLVTTLSVSLGIGEMQGLPEHMQRKARALEGCAMNSFRMAHEAGLTVVLGTDYSNSPNTPFREIGKEFYSLTRCGYTPMEAIKAGTTNGALLMKSRDQFGQLKAGMLADLVVVDGNPLEDIRILGHADHVKMVLIGGAVQKNTL